ncbi:hypothetical protein [Bifidobacterium choloepi]|uniref:Uncharacterized protein n=1 Tax=Bifidobacterium choloepi TaxID=2614131 RepID=A0A6I5NDT6_9BIFI|nr:hypothetical protein [Bifidobacterium choloepi]NEG69554.1 hypothetical protein [Bifidobacterium choloepi]
MKSFDLSDGQTRRAARHDRHVRQEARRHGHAEPHPVEPSCGKIRYPSAIAARLALASMQSATANGDRQECRYYRCPDCHGWHLTSMARFSSLPTWRDVIDRHPKAAALIADCASIMSADWLHNRKRFEAFAVCSFTAVDRAAGGAPRGLLEDVWVWRMMRRDFSDAVRDLSPSPTSHDLGRLKAAMMPLARRIVRLHGDQRPSELTADELTEQRIVVGFMERRLLDHQVTPPPRRWLDRLLVPA